MRKKLLGSLFVCLSCLALAACSSKNELDGKWYGVDYEGNKVLALEIDGDTGKLDFSGNHSITNVDREHSTFSFVDGKEYTVSYILDDEDNITIDFGDYVFTGPSEVTYYREYSKTLKEEIQEVKESD